jgi:O-antigen ligase
VVACVFVGAVLNVVDFLRPGLFIPLLDPLAHPGRGAGFYMNPNSAGVALVIGMVLGAGILAPRMRLVLMLVAGVGVAATLSRSSILVYLVAVVGLTFSGTVGWRQVFVVLGAAVGGAIAASQALVGLVPEIAEVDWRDFLERVQWFTQPGGVVDASASDRQMVAAAALDLYMQHPWIGLGFGYTSHWQVGIAPHNQYLFFMVEYGLAGVLLFPALLIACVWRSRGADGRDAVLAVVLFALLGMFSHDLVHDYYAVCGFALAAAMSRYSDVALREHGLDRGGGRVCVEAFDGPPAPLDPAGR